MTKETDMMQMFQNMTPEQMQMMMTMMVNMMKKSEVDPDSPEYAAARDAGIEAKTRPDTGTYYEYFNEGKINCVIRQEQFYDDALYTTIFKAITNEILQNQLQEKLERQAKYLGGTILAQMFKRNCTAKKREVKKEKEEQEKEFERRMREREKEEKEKAKKAGKMTGYTKLPADIQNMYVSDEWIADDDGVRKFEESGKTVKEVEACMYPILVSKLYRPLDNAASGATRRVEVHFGSEEGWQKATVEREVISNVNKIISLSNMGAGITSDNARQCVNFMASMMKESSKRGALKIVNTLNKLGWDKGFKNFLPYTTDDYVFERQDELPDMMAALSEQGNREEWYKKFKEIRALNYAPFKLATAALLASVILPMLPKQDSFIANL